MNIHWIIPTRVGPGSGGTRTIAQVAEELGKNNSVTISVANEAYEPEEVQGVLRDSYGMQNAIVVAKKDIPSSLDVVVATAWNTVSEALNTPARARAYFVQDFEPWFMPMGYDQIQARLTYSQDLRMVTIGRWLPVKLQQEANGKAEPFDFCVDSSIYHRLDSTRERAICVVLQPEKPRRCHELLLQALRIVKHHDPSIHIYSYGSGVPLDDAETADAIDTQLGLLPVEELASLYNRCGVGVCCSSSNPSRIPFEMMACGLPVVDLHMENNLYDLPSDATSLAYPDPASMAEAILGLFADDNKRQRMSEAGFAFMAERTIEREKAMAAELIEKIGSGAFAAQSTQEKKYLVEGVRASSELYREATIVAKLHEQTVRERLEARQREEARIAEAAAAGTSDSPATFGIRRCIRHFLKKG